MKPIDKIKGKKVLTDADMIEAAKKIIVISDGTGKTAKRLMDAILAHYAEAEVNFVVENIFQNVRTIEKLNEILTGVDASYLVIFSIISRDQRKFLHKHLTDRKIEHLNVLEPMLKTISRFLGVMPDYEPGILQAIDDSYYRKVDSIGYTVEHDDGRGALLQDADLVLVGLSRTCKTPISMFLACNYGMKVANIPLVADENVKNYLLDRLKDIDPKRIIGLKMRPDVLVRVREERMQYLARAESYQAEIKDYCNIQTINDELRFCRRLFNQQGWDCIDVTRRAIEEISHEVLDKIGYNE